MWGSILGVPYFRKPRGGLIPGQDVGGVGLEFGFLRCLVLSVCLRLGFRVPVCFRVSALLSRSDVNWL